jgi:LPXTG-motif cell wall-anchored protein
MKNITEKRRRPPLSPPGKKPGARLLATNYNAIIAKKVAANAVRRALQRAQNEEIAHRVAADAVRAAVERANANANANAKKKKRSLRQMVSHASQARKIWNSLRKPYNKRRQQPSTSSSTKGSNLVYWTPSARSGGRNRVQPYWPAAPVQATRTVYALPPAGSALTTVPTRPNQSSYSTMYPLLGLVGVGGAALFKRRRRRRS